MVAGRRDPATPRTRARLSAALLTGGTGLVGALLLTWPLVLVPLAGMLLALAALNRRQLRALLNKWLWLGLALAVVLPIWLIGTPGDRSAAHAGRSLAALTAGLTLAARVLGTLAALLLLTGCLSPAAISHGLGRLLGRDIALACAIGVNLLPAVLEILRRTTLALRLRGGFRHNRLANLRRLAAAVGVQTVRLTEDVAEALLLTHAPREDASEQERLRDGLSPGEEAAR